MPNQPIEVYTNPHGDIVIRQPKPGKVEAPAIVVERSRVAALVERLLEELRKPLD